MRHVGSATEEEAHQANEEETRDVDNNRDESRRIAK